MEMLPNSGCDDGRSWPQYLRDWRWTIRLAEANTGLVMNIGTVLIHT